MASASEYRTRREKIDVFLSRAAGDVNDPSHMVIGIDTKQSDSIDRN